MNAPRQPLFAGRGFARRLVELPCELYTSRADEPLIAWGTNLSESGIFVETDMLLDRGEDLVVCFRPAVEWHASGVTVFAEIARAAAGRRRDDGAPGLGLRFLNLTRAERRQLTRWLRPRPRTAAGVRQSTSILPCAPRHSLETDHPFAARVS
jgi:hypothetical protein